MDLKPGATHEITWTVTPDKTADAMGNRGVKVFATPWLIGMLEDVCGAMIKPHLAPAATAERGKIREFARAIGDLNPFYLEDRVAAASEWADVIAPPTFATTFRDEGADTNALLRELGTDISRVLHGEQEFEIHRQLQPGQTYLCRAKVADIYEKRGK